MSAVVMMSRPEVQSCAACQRKFASFRGLRSSNRSALVKQAAVLIFLKRTDLEDQRGGACAYTEN